MMAHRPGTQALLPARPSLTSDGCYYKPELWNYVNQCRKKQIAFYRMAEDLDVPLDRIIYMMGSGFDLIFKEQLRAQAA